MIHLSLVSIFNNKFNIFGLGFIIDWLSCVSRQYLEVGNLCNGLESLGINNVGEHKGSIGETLLVVCGHWNVVLKISSHLMLCIVLCGLLGQ